MGKFAKLRPGLKTRRSSNLLASVIEGLIIVVEFLWCRE